MLAPLVFGGALEPVVAVTSADVAIPIDPMDFRADLLPAPDARLPTDGSAGRVGQALTEPGPVAQLLAIEATSLFQDMVRGAGSDGSGAGEALAQGLLMEGEPGDEVVFGDDLQSLAGLNQRKGITQLDAELRSGLEGAHVEIPGDQDGGLLPHTALSGAALLGDDLPGDLTVHRLQTPGEAHHLVGEAGS